MPWEANQLRAAESLRVTLLEVILRLTDSMFKNQAAAQHQQEVLIAELNHRVRNILQLIRSLIQQSNDGTQDIDSFTKIVGGRIHALAQAHDLITKKNWAPASLIELIKKETQAFLGVKANRVIIEGPDILISPQAFTTLALVTHEMVTNAAKYGALCDQSGLVKITLKDTKQYGFHIHWQEIGGPAVKPPARTGFGTTIIERSIPYELQGKADISFHEQGFQGLFSIPNKYLTRTKSQQAFATEVKKLSSSPDVPPGKLISGMALLVEDTMLLALGAERHLRKLGARDVLIASNIEEAHKILNRYEADIDFCLLDVNLEGENSAPIAWALNDKGIPFGLATGYDGIDNLIGDFPKVQMITKPYGLNDIAQLITRSKSLVKA